MEYSELIEGLKKYGSLEENLCERFIGVTKVNISKNVVIAPWWEPLSFPAFSDAKRIGGSDFTAVTAWQTGDITYIKTGIGAPCLMDVVLALGTANVEKLVFLGSVGALDKSMEIGDVVVPLYSVAGDGASRYISGNCLKDTDVLGEKVYPDTTLNQKLKEITERVCKGSGIKCHEGKAYATDSIFAQFTHIDEIINFDCNCIEMETAAAFRAAKIANVKMTALFVVSDSTVAKKSFVSGREEDEIARYRSSRKELFPKIIHELFK